MSQRIACVIPAYQAGGTVATVAGALRAALPEAFLVGVDDGSTDATEKMLRFTCDAVVTYPVNRGKGAALRAGFDVALSEGAEVVLTVDADGQHDTAAAPSLVRELSRADLAIGVRARSVGGMPIGRRVTNAASSLAMSACTGTRLRDPQSGYRAFRRAVLERVEATGDRYEYESDLLLGALRAGFRVAEVEVATLYGPPSHFIPWGDSVKVIGTIGRHCLAALASRPSLPSGAGRVSASSDRPAS